ncbi:MAG: hypothetical protein QOD03_584, partial [Verrucomicrobiota bacterium]
MAGLFSQMALTPLVSWGQFMVILNYTCFEKNAMDSLADLITKKMR